MTDDVEAVARAVAAQHYQQFYGPAREESVATYADISWPSFRSIAQAAITALLSLGYVKVAAGEVLLRPEGDIVTLAECPPGMFLFDRHHHGGPPTLAMKSEYGNNEGRIDAYIVSSGEFFWGPAPQTIANQRKLMVQPLSPNPPPKVDP